MRRALLAGLLGVLLLAGAGLALPAWAEWTTSASGPATARAGTLDSPSPLTIGTVTCTRSNGTTTATLPVSWPEVPGAVQYTVEASLNSGFSPVAQSGTVTRTSATFTTTNQGFTAYFRVRALAGKWISANSATVSKAINC